ncbi:MAG: hypothetical protein LBK61_03165 [Spirochaetaceae bacterium]|jgi:hypothetical protein|nr:hypothetical protein [Spirochaetaceae bacterium]
MKPVEHFIESLSRLCERKFFEISRNFLGDVRTPYNKQAIIERLISYLSNRACQEVMLSYITDDDALVVNTVELLDSPTLHDIYAFFAAQFSYAECIRLTTSLEERLILYSFIDSGQEHYALNPVFGRTLERVLGKQSVLFPCLETKPEALPVPAVPVSKLFLFGFFSFIHSRKVSVKADYTLPRKTEEEAAAFFPGHSFSELLAASEYLGLVSISGNACHINMRAVLDFLKLPEKECLSYLVAGMCADKRYAGLAVNLLASLSPEKYYAPTAVHRMLWIIFHKSAPHFAPAFDKLLAALLKTGLLAGTEDAETGEKWFSLPPNPDKQKETDNPAQTASVSVMFDSPFTFVILPDADIPSIFDSISFSAVENMQTNRYAVSKEMAVRCFETGCESALPVESAELAQGDATAGNAVGNAAWIIDRLETFSGGRGHIDETLVWTLNEWEKRFSEVILHEGLVLCLGKERRYLAETAGLKPYLKKMIAEDVFIIDPKHRDAVEAVLTKSGVDIIGRAPVPSEAEDGTDDITRRPVFFPALSSATFSPQFFAGEHESAQNTPAGAVDHRQTFRTMLAALGAADNEKQELFARIERGLIFSADQLKKLSFPGTFPYEKTEAHGMDYTGKLLIAKSALSNHSPVEICWHTEDGEKKMLCAITDIEKTPSGDILFVTANQQEQRIPLGKVSVIRRIKQSIFE